MMGGMSPKTCRALYKHGIIKSFDALLHLIGYFYMNEVWNIFMPLHVLMLI